ncbi:MAG: hypothetical protein ACTSUE_16245 [Promethearchaeota archaeon]
MADPIREAEIKERIKHYLVLFDGYSSAIEGIRKTCDIPPKELKKLPKDIQLIRKKQKENARKVHELQERGEQMRDGKEKNKKLKKIQEKIYDLNSENLALEMNLKDAKQREDVIQGCEGEAWVVEERLKGDYKAILVKLLNAKKMFPEIYRMVEDELEIHFLTPL